MAQEVNPPEVAAEAEPQLTDQIQVQEGPEVKVSFASIHGR